MGLIPRRAGLYFWCLRQPTPCMVRPLRIESENALYHTAHGQGGRLTIQPRRPKTAQANCIARQRVNWGEQLVYRSYSTVSAPELLSMSERRKLGLSERASTPILELRAFLPR